MSKTPATDHSGTIKQVGLVGARGHTGRELLRLIARHPALSLAFAGSREFAGKSVASLAPEIGDGPIFEAVSAEGLREKDMDIIVLALPDGASEPYVAAMKRFHPSTPIIDLSADYRFTDEWAYGLPELHRLKNNPARLSGAQHIANPGCYATALQLAIAPLLGHLDGVPSVFGVSGYSGAGTTPSPKNDPARIADNMMAYKLTGHNHEREASRHLTTPIRFTPHVHPIFSGLITTSHIPIKGVQSVDALMDIFGKAYAEEPLVALQSDPPELKQGEKIPGIILGGFALSDDKSHAVIVSAIDNLLKGAAIQAVQNINLALGIDEFTGITLA